MALIGLNPEATVDFIHSQDADPENSPTIFKLGTFSAKALKLVNREMVFGKDGDMQMGGYLLEAVRHGVKGWTGLIDQSGADVQPVFSGKEPNKILSDESLALIGPYALEIGVKVMEVNKLSEEQEKN